MKLNDLIKEAYRYRDREAFKKRSGGGAMPIEDLWKVGDKMLPKDEADEYVTKKLLGVMPKEKEKEINSISLEEKLNKAKKLGLKL
jgi:hypothetical protein